VERYEEPSDDVLAWFSAQGLALSQEQRYQIAQLEVVEGSEGLLALWGGLSGSVEERIAAANAVQERRALEGWRLETDYRADREAEERADAARRRASQERVEAAQKERKAVEARERAARDKRWETFEQAKADLMRQWGKGAWTTLEEDLQGVTWGEQAVRLQVRQTSGATAKKASFLSTAMSEILGTAFRVEIVTEPAMKANAQQAAEAD
jgi:hypothetical protein